MDELTHQSRRISDNNLITVSVVVLNFKTLEKIATFFHFENSKYIWPDVSLATI